MADVGDATTRLNDHAVLREWALAIKADANGEPCQCAIPDYTGQRSHLCFRCGLYNPERKAEIRRAMGTPHPFEPAGQGGILSLFCDFCTYPKDHDRHAPARLGTVKD